MGSKRPDSSCGTAVSSATMGENHGRPFHAAVRASALIVVAATIAIGAATNPAVTLTIDAGSNRHPISPLIYGVAFATARLTF